MGLANDAQAQPPVALPRPPRVPSVHPPAPRARTDAPPAPPARARESRRPPSVAPPPPPAPAAPRLYLDLAPSDASGDEAWLWGPEFPEHAWSEASQLVSVVVVRRNDGERAVECDAGDLALRKGESVLLEGERGAELGVVVAPPRRRLVEQRLPARVLRRAGAQDLAAETRARLREAEAVRSATEAVRALGLPTKVVRAEVGLGGGGRVTLYLASEERVELRELAKRLSGVLRARIEFRHVGLRDAARVVGGIGPCGLQLCCNTFLAEFAPVSIRMAKDQGLALNPQRVSGVCGRLMCCLVYEDAFYRAQRALFPKHGKRVVTPRGEGVVRDVDVLARTVRVSLAEGAAETFSVDEVRPVHASGAHPQRGDGAGE